MRSVVYLQPGERRGCVGCHEPMGLAPAFQRGTAFARGPSRLQPGPDGTRPFSYPRLVQPVLDRHCLACHDPATRQARKIPDLTGRPDGLFSRSYNALKPYLRWYEWGGASITATATYPGRIGADESRLMKILADATHRSHVSLPKEDRDRLLLWLDANVPFFGTYEAAALQQQRAGKAVPPPTVQ
jgi:hypothetical protein